MADKCPDCPYCGHPPQLRVGTTQAFCGTDDCRCVMWNPTITQAENFRDFTEIDLP